MDIHKPYVEEQFNSKNEDKKMINDLQNSTSAHKTKNFATQTHKRPRCVQGDHIC